MRSPEHADMRELGCSEPLQDFLRCTVMLSPDVEPVQGRYELGWKGYICDVVAPWDVSSSGTL